MTLHAFFRAAIVAGVAFSASAAMAADISGAGATFPYPVYAKWADAYKKETGIGVNYQSIGSGGGIKQIMARTVTFGASDMPLKPEQLAKGDLIQFPMVMGGIVPVVNLDGVGSNQLTLDGATLARIYLGEITRWDDAALRKLNPEVALPATPIVVVHRSDGSGTTFIFTNYLAKVSSDWKAKIGSSTAVEWPAGLGAKGNEGVANNVGQAKGAIGYVEAAYARQNGLTAARLVNRDGQRVAASAASIQAAAAGADWTKAPGFHVILTDEPGPAAWPIAGATFILFPKKPRDEAAARAALSFFAWAYEKGDAMAGALDYVPMPDNVVRAVRAAWAQNITAADGKPLFGAASN